MKRTLFILAIALTACYGYGQTNTFPSTGNTGIGTTSPSNLLTVGSSTTRGVERIIGTSSAAPVLVLDNTNASGGIPWYIYSGNNVASAFSIENTIGNNFVLASNGNAGIGTASPGNKLDVNGTAAAPNLIANSGYASFYQSGGYARITVGGFTSGSFAGWIQSSDGAGSALSLSLEPSSGNVGIGTTSPGYKLDVQGGNASIYNAGTQSSLDIGSVATGKTYLEIKTSGDANGYASLQSVGISGTSFGNIAFNPFGGNVGIGTTNPGAYMLAVKGNVHAQQVNVDMTGWSDYVFKRNYVLPPLAEVKTYIDQNHHLPDIPSEQQIVKDGLDLGEMNKLLMKKVEELTLYLIEKDKQVNNLQDELTQLKQSQQKEIDELKQQVSTLIKSKP